MGGALHSFGCCDGTNASSEVTVSALSQGDVGDSGAPTAAIHCHCFSCSGVMLPESAVSSSVESRVAVASVLPYPVLHAHAPGLDTPPPRILA